MGRYDGRSFLSGSGQFRLAYRDATDRHEEPYVGYLSAYYDRVLVVERPAVDVYRKAPRGEARERRTQISDVLVVRGTRSDRFPNRQ